jgi:hypothetical protein
MYNETFRPKNATKNANTTKNAMINSIKKAAGLQLS